jgi:O-antigen/teichoic acid export membrane protein
MDRAKIASRVSSHTIFNLLANFSRIVIGSIALIFIARQLGPSQYGVVSLGLSIAAIAGIFCDFGISTSTACFLAKNDQPNSSMFHNGWLLNLVFSFTFSLILFLSSKSVAALTNIGSAIYIQIICVFTFFTSLFHFSTRSLQGIKKTDKIALLNFLHNIITSALIIIIAYIGYKARGVLYGYSLSTTIIWIITLIFIQKYFKLFKINFNLQSLKQIATYALPLLLTSSSYFLILRGPAILLGAFTGMSEVSYLNIPMRIVEVISLPAYSLAIVISPYFTQKELETGNPPWLYLKILKYSLFFYLPIAVFLFVASSRIIGDIFGSQYHNASNVLLVLSVYLPFFAIATITGRILDFLGLAKQKSIIFVAAAAATIISSFIVIPAFKEIGAALVIVIPYTLFSVYTIIKSSKACGITLNKYLLKLASLITITIISCLPVVIILHNLKGLKGLVLSFICFGILFLIFALILKLIRFQEVRNIVKLLK